MYQSMLHLTNQITSNLKTPMSFRSQQKALTGKRKRLKMEHTHRTSSALIALEEELHVISKKKSPTAESVPREKRSLRSKWELTKEVDSTHTYSSEEPSEEEMDNDFDEDRISKTVSDIEDITPLAEVARAPEPVSDHCKRLETPSIDKEHDTENESCDTTNGKILDHQASPSAVSYDFSSPETKPVERLSSPFEDSISEISSVISEDIHVYEESQEKDQVTPVCFQTKPVKQGSRILHESKRKEIWQGLKKAEEITDLLPPISQVNSVDRFVINESKNDLQRETLVLVKYHDETKVEQVTSPSSSSSESRLDNLLQNLRSELSSIRTEKVKSPLLQRSASINQWKSSSGNDTYASSSPYRDASSGHRMGAVSENSIDEEYMNNENQGVHSFSLATTSNDLNPIVEDVLRLENENKLLRDQNQSLILEEANLKEQFTILKEKLSLMNKKQDQLTFQTQHLLTQNQTLQSDLLEKIQSETDKIQNMERLINEKQSLMEKIYLLKQRNTEHFLEENFENRTRLLKRLVLKRRREFLQQTLIKWFLFAQKKTFAHAQALSKLKSVMTYYNMKKLLFAWQKWHFVDQKVQYEQSLQEQKKETKEMIIQKKSKEFLSGLKLLDCILEKKQQFQRFQYWNQWKLITKRHQKFFYQISLASTKLKSVLNKRTVTNCFIQWKDFYQKQTFDLVTKENTFLHTKVEENQFELQLVKHCFVVLCLKKIEQKEVFDIFHAWHVQALKDRITRRFSKEIFNLEQKNQRQEIQLKALDNFHQVLKNDIERYKFFSQDKRITIDILTKKLLREEEKKKQFEEQIVCLEEKMLTWKKQIHTFVQWEEMELNIPLLTLCKEMALSKLHDIFLLHCTDTMKENKDGENDARMSLDALFCLLDVILPPFALNYHRELTFEKLQVHFPNAAENDISFKEFIIGITGFLEDLYQLTYQNTTSKISTNTQMGEEVSTSKISRPEFIKQIWKKLLNSFLRTSLVMATRNDENQNKNISLQSDFIMSPRSSWAGKLSDDILQNQEKLLAVLEHETAVVERAVREQSSLKHTYSSVEQDTKGKISNLNDFEEYQCEPFDAPATNRTQRNMEEFGGWQTLPIVRDLFMAFRVPISQIMSKYSDDSLTLELNQVFKIMEDLGLCPSFVSKELIQELFFSTCDSSNRLSVDGLNIFFGTCALEIYARSLPNKCEPPHVVRLSAREIIMSFFVDIGFLNDSQIPLRICFPGVESENAFWSLFEYYALSSETPNTTNAHCNKQIQDRRTYLSVIDFMRFMADLVGHDTSNTVSSSDETIANALLRVKSESRRPDVLASSSSSEWVMYLDDFYAILSYLQQAKNPRIQDPGEALRQWMQEAQ
jgi:hypothetical protein